MPFFKSLVETGTGFPSPGRLRLLAGSTVGSAPVRRLVEHGHDRDGLCEHGERAAAILGDDQGVLDPDPSGPREVHPGSTVTIMPGERIAVPNGLTVGASWMSRPTRAQCRARTSSAQPASAMTARHTPSTSFAPTPGPTAATPSACERPTTSNTRASSPSGSPPTQKVRVMSER